MLLGKKIGNSKRENKLLLYVFVRIRVKTKFHKGKHVPDFLCLLTVEKKHS